MLVEEQWRQRPRGWMRSVCVSVCVYSSVSMCVRVCECEYMSVCKSMSLWESVSVCGFSSNREEAL